MRGTTEFDRLGDTLVIITIFTNFTISIFTNFTSTSRPYLLQSGQRNSCLSTSKEVGWRALKGGAVRLNVRFWI